ncbi:CDP-alcohol phosphatidyltransferase [Aquisphaera giovannonii]|uniref:CDP-alcohol phosphatidyltransferase n=1 Tax=Aquisphaera giovannonii TaxID=406548 RepID=A0A5B9WBM6_9BACT|nr:CDP-alcohol phosphatidyltransferase family protein [Aquisphaera giovannonii]QEH37674.1 CDP-alcohol phosphatidyltransferase [Aquisphaera giovannonii]
MASRGIQLVIDARPRGPSGPLAVEPLLGRPVLARLLDQAAPLASDHRPIAVHAREDEHELLRGLVAEAAPGRAVLATGPPLSGATVLRTDRLYDARRLRRAIRRGADVESAVVWRLDQGRGLAAAEEELKRRLTYQPLGRFWAFGLARALAEALAPTRVRPNIVTLAAAGLMLAASAMVAFGGPAPGLAAATAAALAAALVLDTADGRLARLQGTSSPFGRWLDQVLDELADMSLHAAIAWSAYASSGDVRWLLLGMAYPSGKYIFVMQSLGGEALERAWEPAASRPAPSRRLRRWARPARRAVEMAGHADVRWHLWIVLAAMRRLDLALVAYAAYFPLRALAGGLRKAVGRA